jgi:hypothetical protein
LQAAFIWQTQQNETGEYHGQNPSATISAGVFLSYFHVIFAQKAFNLD